MACASEAPRSAPSSATDCPPNTHAEGDACVLDPPAEGDSGAVDATGHLRVANHTESAWRALWLCDAGGCSSTISGVGSLVDPGGSLTVDLEPDREHTAMVVDDADRCAATPGFTVDADEVWEWVVDAYVGVWREADPFGCVRL
jgi:hypothetical protein